ncbi:hypothetical protein [Comamonas sp. JUb58]|uniref:hypothetical protein n=1 Tax=Comamonas sp. JUb58 TaxID=2485114 RepID=UPI0010604819|nr:hypothetical protein [Comamonas sp. JUb58]TDS82577.1 hypothetical protein EDF71_107213 [Comamonas sp. JUb58]
MTDDKTEAQPEALRVAAWLINAPFKTTHGDMLVGGRELRRLHAETEAQAARIAELEAEKDFYKRRCDALQAAQSTMRDPERTVVCDILANGHLLQDGTGKLDATRYAQLSARQAAPDGRRLVPVDPVAWTLQSELDAKQTTTNGHLWFSNPVNACWTALYTEQQVLAMLSAAPFPPEREPLKGGQ